MTNFRHSSGRPSGMSAWDWACMAFMFVVCSAAFAALVHYLKMFPAAVGQ